MSGYLKSLPPGNNLIAGRLFLRFVFYLNVRICHQENGQDQLIRAERINQAQLLKGCTLNFRARSTCLSFTVQFPKLHTKRETLSE